MPSHIFHRGLKGLLLVINVFQLVGVDIHIDFPTSTAVLEGQLLTLASNEGQMEQPHGRVLLPGHPRPLTIF